MFLLLVGLFGVVIEMYFCMNFEVGIYIVYSFVITFACAKECLLI
jgi:hypothetical protein